MNYDLLRKLKVIGVVQKEPITLRSGVVSDLYCDVRVSFGYPEIINALADEVAKLIPKDTTAVAASGYGGLPLAAIVTSRHNLKLVGVRDNEKTHGKGGVIAGYMPNEKDIVVIIDDVLTTGSSIKTTLAGLQTTAASVVCAIVVVKRGDVDLSIPYHSIFSINDLTA